MTMDFKIALAGARLRRQAANLRVGYRPGASGHCRGKDNRIHGRSSQASGHDRGGQPRTGAGLLRLSGLQEPCAARQGDKIPTGVRR